jgi:hypothetical protein
MHQFLKFIYFDLTLYMFRPVFPSVIRSSRLYIQQQVYVTDTATCLLWVNTLLFRTVFPSVIRSSRLYIQQQVYVKQILISKQINLRNLCIWLVYNTNISVWVTNCVCVFCALLPARWRPCLAETCIRSVELIIFVVFWLYLFCTVD